MKEILNEWRKYVLVEANVTSLIQRHKIPKELAEYVNERFRINADALIAIYVSRYRSELENHIDHIINDFKRFMDFKGNMVNSFLKKNPKKKEFIVDLATKNWREFIVFTKKIQDEEEIEKIIDFPDGFFWVDLKSDFCRKEGEQMGHCGKGMYGGNLYSLRDPSGKPHVTIEKLDDILYQIKGKENDFPVDKYWPYIKYFLSHFNLTADNIREPQATPEFIKSI
jgi:hypothetical protein